MKKQQINTLKERIKYVLKKHPQTRNSDLLLMQEIWKEFFTEKVISRKTIIESIMKSARNYAFRLGYGEKAEAFLNSFERKFTETTADEKLFINIENLFSLPREDSIKRIRAIVQNKEGLYIPTSWEVAKKRHIKELEWKKALGYSTFDIDKQHKLIK